MINKIGKFINDGEESKLSPAKAFWLYYWVWGSLLMLFVETLFDFFFLGSKWKYWLTFAIYIKVTEETWKCSKNFKNLKQYDWRQILFKIFLGILTIFHFIGFGIMMEWWGPEWVREVGRI